MRIIGLFAGDSTKTPSGSRFYPLTENLRKILEPRLNFEDPKALIFSNNGKPINESNINRIVKRICTHARNKNKKTKEKES